MVQLNDNSKNSMHAVQDRGIGSFKPNGRTFFVIYNTLTKNQLDKI